MHLCLCVSVCLHANYVKAPSPALIVSLACAHLCLRKREEEEHRRRAARAQERERDEDSEEVEQRAGGSDQVFVERFVSLSVCRSESGRQEAGDEGLQRQNVSVAYQVQPDLPYSLLSSLLHLCFLLYIFTAKQEKGRLFPLKSG